jgi:DNA-directed RNA polymerase specialized sigma24 family protein
MTPSAPPTLADRAAAAFAAYREGDRERMGELVDLLTPILWHTARGQRLDQATSEDVIQTAWIRLVEGAEAIAEPQAVLAWLITTVRRESWRVLKRDGRSIPVEEFPETEPDGLLAALDPAAEAMLREDQRVLWRAVKLAVGTLPGAPADHRLYRPPRLRCRLGSPGYAGRLDRPHPRALSRQTARPLAADPTWSTP